MNHISDAQKFGLELEAVTPLFLSGADQNEAELRAPSFKGAVRFWFRTMMGAVVGNAGESRRK